MRAEKEEYLKRKRRNIKIEFKNEFFRNQRKKIAKRKRKGKISADRVKDKE